MKFYQRNQHIQFYIQYKFHSNPTIPWIDIEFQSWKFWQRKPVQNQRLFRAFPLWIFEWNLTSVINTINSTSSINFIQIQPFIELISNFKVGPKPANLKIDPKSAAVSSPSAKNLSMKFYQRNQHIQLYILCQFYLNPTIHLIDIEFQSRPKISEFQNRPKISGRFQPFPIEFWNEIFPAQSAHPTLRLI